MKQKEVFVGFVLVLILSSFVFGGVPTTSTGEANEYDTQLEACQQSPSTCSDWGQFTDTDIAANAEKLSGSQWDSLGPDRMKTITASMSAPQMQKINLKDPQIKAAFDKMPIGHRIGLMDKLNKEQRRYVIRQTIRDFLGLNGNSDYNLDLSSDDLDEFKAYLAEEGIDVDIDIGSENIRVEKDKDGNSVVTTPDGTSISIESLKGGTHTISVTADGVTIDGTTYKGGEVVDSDSTAPSGTYTVTTTDEFTYPILTDTQVSGNSISGMTVYPNGTVQISNVTETHIKNSSNEVIIKNGANVIINPDGSYTADYIGQLRDGKLVMLNAYNVSSDGNLTADKADSAIIEQSVATTITDYYYDKDDTFAVGGADLIIVDGSYFADVGSTPEQKTTFTTDQGKLTEATLVSAKDNNSFDIPFYEDTATFTYDEGDIISFTITDPYMINLSAYTAFTIPFMMYSTGYKIHADGYANNNNGGIGRLSPIRHPEGGVPRLILAALLFGFVAVRVCRSLTADGCGMVAA